MNQVKIIFPNNYSLIHPIKDQNIKLIGSFDLGTIQGLVKTEPGFTTISVDLNETKYYLALRGFHIYQPMRKAHSAGSQAIYLGRSEDKREGLLLQYLPPESHTSRHKHEIRTEAYHSIAGEITLLTDRGNLFMQPGATQVIQPNTFHQVQTNKQAAVTLLEIVNDPEGLSMGDHIYG